MSTVIRNVTDIDERDRHALEHLLGRRLGENERLVIQVEPLTAEPAPALPGWCNVYAGLSDEEIAEVEKIALSRSELTRPSK